MSLFHWNKKKKDGNYSKDICSLPKAQSHEIREKQRSQAQVQLTTRIFKRSSHSDILLVLLSDLARYQQISDALILIWNDLSSFMTIYYNPK